MVPGSGPGRAGEKRLAHRYGKMVNRIGALSRYLPEAGDCSKKALFLPAPRRFVPISFAMSHPLPETKPPQPALTDDTLFQGDLIVRQNRDGYRFSVDAVLAAHFAAPQPGDQVLDLGCGCGVIGLILAYRHPLAIVCGLELQESLAALAEENRSRNDFIDRFRVIRGDVRTIAAWLAPETFDLVVCNPPYRKLDSGRINQDSEAARARHELTAEVDDFVRASAFCVRNRGRVVFVYPAVRLPTLLIALFHHRLTLKRLQPVYSYPGAANARLVLVEAAKNGGEQSEILAPLYIYAHQNGDYTPEMLALYRENPCSPR